MSVWILIALGILVLAGGASIQAALMAGRGKARGALGTPANQRRLRRLKRREEAARDEEAKTP